MLGSGYGGRHRHAHCEALLRLCINSIVAHCEALLRLCINSIVAHCEALLRLCINSIVVYTLVSGSREVVR